MAVLMKADYMKSVQRILERNQENTIEFLKNVSFLSKLSKYDYQALCKCIKNRKVIRQ